MLWLVTKYGMTAAVVVLVSEAAKRSDKLGGLIAGHHPGIDLAIRGTATPGKNR